MLLVFGEEPQPSLLLLTLGKTQEGNGESDGIGLRQNHETGQVYSQELFQSSNICHIRGSLHFKGPTAASEEKGVVVVVGLERVIGPGSLGILQDTFRESLCHCGREM